jgi:hypothetical protein
MIAYNYHDPDLISYVHYAKHELRLINMNKKDE